MSTADLTHRVLLRRVPASVGVPREDGKIDPYARWIAVLLAVGIAARLLRYLLRFPLWGDEALLAVNFIDRDFASLMRPLECHQVAPLLFLWTELAAVKVLGYSEWSLRLFPLLCGVGSMLLFDRLARSLLRGPALVLAVGFFAVCYSGIRYSSEVKPYSVDLMVSTLVVLLMVRWWRRPDETRWLWMLAASMPILLGLSYPAIFVAGGASIAMAGAMRTPRAQRAWAVYNAAVVVSFLGWYCFAIRTQSQAELGVMTVCWNDAFPPLDSVAKLAAWLVEAHAGPLLAVPVGGDRGGSAATLLLCAVAAVTLVRQRRYRLLVLCAAPFALNLIAAAMRRYPYGGHMRLTMHLVPIVSILAGIGAAALLERIGRRRMGLVSRPVNRMVTYHDGLGSPSYNLNRRLGVAIGVLLLLAIATIARDFYMPGKVMHDIRKRDFAAWFWSSLDREHEVICTAASLPAALPVLEASGRGFQSPQFRCNARIYSPQLTGGSACDLSRVSAQRSLACVHYENHLSPYDAAAFSRWLSAMKQRYDLAASSRYTILQDDDNDRQPEPADHVEVYQFVPKSI